MLACFIGYMVQAVVNNFTPLLFVNLQLGLRHTAREDNASYHN